MQLLMHLQLCLYRCQKQQTHLACLLQLHGQVKA